MAETQQAIFQAQFSHRQPISVNGGRVEAVFITPVSPVEKPDIPILLAPGWSETIDVNRVPLEELYTLGRRVVTLSHARGGIHTNPDSPLPKAIDRKAASLLATLDYFGIDQVDVIAHSEGGINAAVAALQYPSRVRNMVLIGSGGLLPNDNVVKLSLRFIQASIGEAMGNISKYVISNPSWSLQETRAMAQQKSIDLLKNLQTKGIGVSFIHNVEDRVFPIGSLDKDLTVLVGQGRAGFYSVVGNHNAILGDPRITRLAVNALDSLQYKRRKIKSR